METAATAHDLLQQHFGFREFLEGQESIVDSILQGEDLVAIMPTGAGKSLCYQLPALMLDGITVVISPLISLMKDQVDGLLEKKIPATFINSTLSPNELDDRINGMKQGRYRIVYVAPERFKSDRFIQALAPLSIALFAVDEAHCISQWGHDFRPDYLRLRHTLKTLGHPQTMALTATATPDVRNDIVEQLELGKHGRKPPRIFVSGFARHNLTLGVTHAKNQAGKIARIKEFIQQLKTGIIYCSTRKNVEKVALLLKEEGIASIAYHAGMKEEQRTKVQEKFMDGKCPVAVATNAFGMGIDRADLRFVIHYDIPGSLEAYYQEVGRAGRDGEASRCELLFNYADVQTQEFFIEGSNPSREIIQGLYLALMDLCKAGPIEMSIADIKEYVPAAKNDMAVGSALYLLQRAGLIERDYAQGSRVYTTRLVQPGMKFDDLKLDFKALAVKKDRDLGKLRQMIRYADAMECRHRYILRYFGDNSSTEGCTICDNCLAKVSTRVRLPTNEETVVIQKILSCIARVNGRYGRGRICQILTGSLSKEVIDAGLDKLSTHGILSDCSPDWIWSLIDTLIQQGCINVSQGDYPVLTLTDFGGKVMRKQESIRLVMPAIVTAKKPSKSSKKSSIGSPSTNSLNSEDSYDRVLFDKLRKWRKDKASEMGDVPAYLIYADKVLMELSRVKPSSKDELLQVRGIGPAKAERFGDETLDIIKSLP